MLAGSVCERFQGRQCSLRPRCGRPPECYERYGCADPHRSDLPGSTFEFVLKGRQAARKAEPACLRFRNVLALGSRTQQAVTLFNIMTRSHRTKQNDGKPCRGRNGAALELGRSKMS